MSVDMLSADFAGRNEIEAEIDYEVQELDIPTSTCANSGLAAYEELTGMASDGQDGPMTRTHSNDEDQVDGDEIGYDEFDANVVDAATASELVDNPGFDLADYGLGDEDQGGHVHHFKTSEPLPGHGAVDEELGVAPAVPSINTQKSLNDDVESEIDYGYDGEIASGETQGLTADDHAYEGDVNHDYPHDTIQPKREEEVTSITASDHAENAVAVRDYNLGGTNHETGEEDVDYALEEDGLDIPDTGPEEFALVDDQQEDVGAEEDLHEAEELSGQPDEHPEADVTGLLSAEPADGSTGHHEVESSASPVHGADMSDNGEGEFIDGSRPESPSAEVSAIAPDVKVRYRGTTYPLFSSSESDDPDTFFLHDVEALDYPIPQFLISLREVISDDLAPADELVMRIEGLGLEFSETMDKQLIDQITFGQIVDLYDQLVKNDDPTAEGHTLMVFLVTRLNCMRRLKTLFEGAQNSLGLSAFHASFGSHLTQYYPQNGSSYVGDEDEDEHLEADHQDEDRERDDAEDGSLLLDEPNDQVIDEATEEDLERSVHSASANHPQQGVHEHEHAVATVGVDEIILDYSHTEEIETDPQHAEPDQVSQLPEEEHSGDDEPWYGETEGGNGSGQEGLGREGEPLDGRHLESEQDQHEYNQSVPDGDQPIGDNREDELELWDDEVAVEASLEGKPPSPAADDDNAPESPSGAADGSDSTTHLAIMPEQDLNSLEDIGAAGAQTDQEPEEIAEQVIQEVFSESSVSVTLNGDEIDFDDSLATNLTGEADDQNQRNPANPDHSHELDADEIDWEDHEDAGGPEATSSTPASIVGKRSRDVDDAEGLGDRHDVKRQRA